MQESFWWWQCSDRYTPLPHPRHPPPHAFSSSLISLVVSWTLSTMFTYFTYLLEFSVSVSVSVSVSLSLSLFSHFLYHSLAVTLCVSPSPLSVSRCLLPVCLYICICLSVCLCFSVFLWLSLSLSLWLTDPLKYLVHVMTHCVIVHQVCRQFQTKSVEHLDVVTVRRAKAYTDRIGVVLFWLVIKSCLGSQAFP